MTVEEVLLANYTTPVQGVLIDYANYTNWYLGLCRDIRKQSINKTTNKTMSLVDFHKLRLGKQQYCWIGECKNWIWEIKSGVDVLRIYVSRLGLSLEASPNTKPKKLLKMLKDYRRKLLK